MMMMINGWDNYKHKLLLYILRMFFKCFGKRKNKFRSADRNIQNQMLLETIISLQEEVSRNRKEMDYFPVVEILEGYFQPDCLLRPPPRTSSLVWEKVHQSETIQMILR